MADGSEYSEVISNLIKAELDQVNTAIPCTIESYSNGRVSVRPNGEKKYQDGDSNPYPILHNLRFVWPNFSNGQAGLKGPVTPGDKCLLIVCQQSIDDLDDLRKFDLVDSYVIPGGGYDDSVPGNDDMRLYFGNAFIAIDGNGKITINAPGGVEETTPLHTVKGQLTVEKMFTYQGGMTASGGDGSVASITGTVNVVGDVVINGIKIGTHKHPGDSGGTTGGPTN
ncbi:baseplate assembly protein [Klebsiella aerogenes]|uniref:Gp138 family membrane-puncturing spike protein n=1 Tax=Klebsiella aerogenes TaxID=548 RepID=UPI00063C4AF1|nr:Gp138 family membrane-puncturing spike protein [Klebsiella aerogenes]KLF56391.1 baseplate assembly protein [Klebsiella aerogenes]